jgi:hypothetical protein
MWYFAYGTDLNATSMRELCREEGLRPIQRKQTLAGVLPNFRLCFPFFHPRWGGGVADLAEGFGKQVYGALIELDDSELPILERINGRRLDGYGREVGSHRLVQVRAETIRGGTPVEALAFRRVRPEYRHVPPSRFYLNRMIDAAIELGLSAMWVMYLRSLTPASPDETPVPRDVEHPRRRPT